MLITASDKKYQLRRMLLINAGTNKHIPSNRITSIDPRGGALVTGPNGVGKTMTLRLLPLFFGFLPSRLVADGDAQKGMVRFILPEETSAIAFEYQRGEEEELRLAVMRRDRTDVNAPFYRIFRCGWDQGLFVRDGIFLTDEEATSTASAQYTKKLTSAEYRAVILRSALISKDKSMRTLQLEHSFGPSPLENLDRLVATMLQDTVNFSDIIQVAVSRVQQNIGSHTEHGRLAFKQRRSQIDDWINRRRAGALALDKAGDVAKLRESMDRLVSCENKIRATWWDVHALKNLKDGAHNSKTTDLQEIEKQWGIAVEQEAGVRRGLNEAIEEANGKHVAACNDHDGLQSKWDYFEKENAQGWKQKMVTFPSLQTALQSLNEQIDAASVQQAEAIKQYEKLKADATKRTEQNVKVLELDKKKPALDWERAHLQIDAEFQGTFEALKAEHEGVMQELVELKSNLREALGEWRQRQKEPQASKEAQEALRDANLRLRDHQDRKLDAERKNRLLANAAQQAKLAFEQGEVDVQKARSRLAKAQADLDQAIEQVNPPAGSVLHVLRNHPDQGWRHNLAKVLDSGLLLRPDLEPSWLEEGGSLYGWSLQTEAIEAPDWIDDAQVRAAIVVYEHAIGAAKAHLAAIQDELARRSKALDQANDVLTKDSAELGVIYGQSEGLSNAVGQAEQELDAQKTSMAVTAEGKVDGLEREVKELDGKINRKGIGWKEQESRLNSERSKLKSEATERRDAALRDIDNAIAEALRQVDLRCKELDDQMAGHLSAQGVDVVRLAAQKTEAAGLESQIQDIERRRPMIKQWDEFTTSGGESQLATSKARAKEASEALGRQREQLTQHNIQWNVRKDEYTSRHTTLNETISRLEADISRLSALMTEIGAKPAPIVSMITLRGSVEELRGRYREEYNELQSVQSEMQTRFSNLRNELLYGENQLGKFVQDWMSQRVDAQASLAIQALELCNCHARIAPEFIRPNNVELRSILANIGSLHATISNFENEVKRVNARLQEGLSQVKCFERIEDLKLNIEPNFDGLGFYKKLTHMSAAIRAYNESWGAMEENVPAPKEIVAALSDFASVLGNDGSLEVNLGQHITLSGSVVDNGKLKQFKREKELVSISSNGLSSILRITLVTALINTMRGSDPVYVPWVTDEIATFDGPNLIALMQMLAENKIDVVTAAPDLDPLLHPQFSQRYIFQDRGRVRVLADRRRHESLQQRHPQPAAFEGVPS